MISTMARRKTPITFTLEPALLAELDAWLETQDPRPSKTGVMESALRLFLDARRGRIECRPVAPKPDDKS